MVGLEKVESPEDVQALQGYISEHYRHTNSSVAKGLLDDYGTAVTKFVKVREKTALGKVFLEGFRRLGANGFGHESYQMRVIRSGLIAKIHTCIRTHMGSSDLFLFAKHGRYLVFGRGE